MPRLLTYNVHRCLGTDRRLDVERIAAVIAAQKPDIVCLQELDVGRARTGGVDQAEAIARALGMTSRFHPAMQIKTELYGDAILTPWPERLVRAAALPTLRNLKGLEPRGAIWSVVTIDGVDLNILTTHLGLVPREQRQQALALAGPDWLGSDQCHGPTILAGDFNATSITRPYQTLTRRLKDAQKLLGLRPSIKTFPSSFPAIRIDHAFVSPEIKVTGMSTPLDPMTRAASDHLPLVMDFQLRSAAS